MPIYEYECRNNACLHRFELIQRLDDQAPVCPQCQGEVKRLISAGTGFSLRGGGWAADGYGDAPPPKEKTS